MQIIENWQKVKNDAIKRKTRTYIILLYVDLFLSSNDDYYSVSVSHMKLYF